MRFFRIFFFLFLFSFQFVKAEKPNILLIVADDLNTRIGPYMQIEKHTPELDRLAKEGVRFTRCYSQFPLCGPSRASFMSGLYPETNGVLRNDDQPGSYKKETPSLANHPSMAGFFREQGYFTARVSKIYHMGVPGGIERGQIGGDEPDSWDYTYNVMAPETLSPGKLELLSPKNKHFGSSFARIILDDEHEDTQADYMAASQAIAILENRAGEVPKYGTNKQRIKKDAPFFLAVGFVRPHVPFVAPKNCFEPYPDNEVVLPSYEIGENVPLNALRTRNNNIWGMNEIQQKQSVSAYMASVRFMDQQVGRLLNALDRLNLRNETIVIFISDHGYNLGEHDCWAKQSLWEGSIRVPMIISVPGLEKTNGKSCSSIAELLDLYPTLIELCGYSEKQPKILQGKSLVEYIKGKETKNIQSVAYTVTNGGKAASLRTENWRYNRWGENAALKNEELYNHKKDPEEQLNLSDNPDYSSVLNDLRQQFEEVRKKARRGLDFSTN